MGVRTTFGMGWWDPDAMVKICFQKITLTNILVRVGQVGQGWSGWSGWSGLVRLGLANVRGRFTCGWTASMPARGWYLITSEPAADLPVCLPEDAISLSVRCSSGAPTVLPILKYRKTQKRRSNGH